MPPCHLQSSQTSLSRRPASCSGLQQHSRRACRAAPTRRPHRHPARRRGLACYAAVQRPRRDDIEPYAGIELAPLPVGRWDHERAWLAGLLALWLDEEWVAQDVHRQLGEFAAKIYVNLRAEGCNELTDILMGTTNRLVAFDFGETFVGPFEVGNKVLEVVMLKEGVEVACEESDRSRFERYQAEQQAQQAQQPAQQAQQAAQQAQQAGQAQQSTQQAQQAQQPSQEAQQPAQQAQEAQQPVALSPEEARPTALSPEPGPGHEDDY